MSRQDAVNGGVGSSNGSIAAQPKQLSSRLMTMKFMQRAAASKSPGAGASPGSAPQTPASEPPSKRRRVESASSTPNRLSDSEQGAPGTTTERASRTIYAQRGDETEWVLDIRLPHGASHLRNEDQDDEDDEEDEGDDMEDGDDDSDTIWPSAATGRQAYGSFQKKAERKDNKHTKNDDDLSSVSGSLADSDDDDDADADDHRHTPAAKAGPGGQWQPFSARGNARGRGGGRGGGLSSGYRNQNSSSYSGSPLAKLPNSKERRRQQRKQPRKTL